MPQKTANNRKLRNDLLWKQGLSLAQNIYSSLEEFEHFPDEKLTKMRLRQSAFDTLFYLSLAIGNYDLTSAVVDWTHACRCLFALQAVYIFACRQKFIELEPQLILEMDTMLEVCRARIAEFNQQLASMSARMSPRS